MQVLVFIYRNKTTVFGITSLSCLSGSVKHHCTSWVSMKER